ncbi:MAG: hypothetical protein KF725_08760 [Cyclobacteriaceae bacterium]|nr:hypothetical protein [Cyclobacteriaceae bacterium]UYN88041.1 MAG: hypothetical protein KIT51_07260 [Cyclobacteriaceae bacterium]
MKNKIISGLILIAIATFSFTAISTQRSVIATRTTTKELKVVKKLQNEPIGGFVSEDQF